MAKVVDVARLRDLHKVLSCAVLSVARGAPRGHIALLHEIEDHLVHRALVKKAELPRHFPERLSRDGVVVPVVGADICLRACAHLAHPNPQEFPAHLGRLAGAEDHPRVGHSDAQDGNQFLEVLVVHFVRRCDGHLGPICCPHARDRNCVRPCAVLGLKVVRVHEHRHHLVAVVIEPKQSADPHIVQARPHGTVVSQESVVKVRLGARKVHLLESRAVIGLLEQRVGPNHVCCLEPLHVRKGERGNLHVAPPNLPARL
mmetsp:Transcript_31861/g.75662  ORF Transcript_31861/g.75662 Transcript_31861/m.75662 type:complete len:258 (-) Transcript_31861:1105-1878(-)